jgi:hypothetical protein
VHELCVALAHRWKPGRLFVILTAYFDESGTHGGSPVTIMAGVLGTANQWLGSERELSKLKSRYGFRVFHTKEFKGRTGEFKGWSPGKQLALLTELVDLSSTSFMRANVFTLINEEFEREYRGGMVHPRKLRLDTSYGMAFRYVLTDLLVEVSRRLGTHKRFAETRMHIVAESGHRHAGDAKRVFDETQQELEGLGSRLLASVTFSRKQDCAPLMVADFLASTTFMAQTGAGMPAPIAEGAAIPEKTVLVHSTFKPNGLADLKASLIDRFSGQKGRQPFRFVAASE